MAEFNLWPPQRDFQAPAQLLTEEGVAEVVRGLRLRFKFRPAVMHFTVEQGNKRYVVCLGREPLEDLAEGGTAETDEQRLKIFDKYRREILERAAKAVANGEAKPDGRVYLELRHFRDFRRVGP